MSTYKVYYKEIGAKNHGIWSSQGTWYIEVSDEYGRKKAQKAREAFYNTHDRNRYEIVRVVKDCWQNARCFETYQR